MDERGRERLVLSLAQLHELRSACGADLESQRYSDNDLRMDRYNWLLNRLRFLMPDDRVLAELKEMPDAVLQAWGSRAPADAAAARTASHVDLLIDHLEFLFPDLSTRFASPETIGGVPFADLPDNERDALGTVQLLAVQRRRPVGLDARPFEWVADVQLRSIIRDDYLEAQRAMANGAPKLAAIGASAAIEGMALEVLSRESVRAHPNWLEATKRLRNGESPELIPRRASLVQIIKALADLGMVESRHVKWVEGVADVRDTVHPNREREAETRVGERDAQILLIIAQAIDDRFQAL